MLKFAANLTMLFTEVPFMERFSLARQAGFTYIEYLFPYAYRAADLKAQLERYNLKQILFNLPAGNWESGERGIAANPERIEEFRTGVSSAIEYALTLGVGQLNCLAGNKLPAWGADKQWDVLVDNIAYAAQKLQEKGLRLVIEPINHFDMPEFFVNRTEQVLKLINEVGMPNVFMQYDIYHAQREEGELTATLRRNSAQIGHIQIADNPGRHQPGTGEIYYPYIFKELEAIDYQGYIGLEYVPAAASKDSFNWMGEYGYIL